MDIVCQERSLDPAEHRVENHSDGQQETCGRCRYSTERACNGRASSKQHGGDEDVRHKTEGEEDGMGGHTISSFDDLEEGMRVGRASLQLDSQRCEE